jgi:hypothetical protein
MLNKTIKNIFKALKRIFVNKCILKNIYYKKLKEFSCIISVMRSALSGLATICVRQGVCTGLPLLSTFIKVVFSCCLTFYSLILFQQPSRLLILILLYTVDLFYTNLLQMPPWSALPQLKTFDSIASLKPKILISYFRFDAFKCL